MENNEEIELHELETIERNLGIESTPECAEPNDEALASPNGFLIA